MREVLTPGHPRYDAEWAGFTRVVDHRPALIVVPTDIADVCTAVRHAADHTLMIARPDAVADIGRAHTPRTRDRLHAIRRAYDPAGRFRRTPEETR